MDYKYYIDHGISIEQRCIHLSGEITENNITPLIRAIQFMGASSKEDITIYINTEGGSVYDGLALIDIISYYKKQGITFHTIANGKCMSMGLFILLIGDKRSATPLTTFMSHPISSGTYGSLPNMEVDMEEAKRLQQLLENFHSRICKMKLKNKDTYFTPYEAMKWKIIQKII
jgi:ATP-dependent Clp protease protease subunit